MENLWCNLFEFYCKDVSNIFKDSVIKKTCNMNCKECKHSVEVKPFYKNIKVKGDK